MAGENEKLDLTGAVQDVMNGLPITMTLQQFNDAVGKISDMTRFFNEIIQEVLRQNQGLSLEANHDEVIELASQLAEQRLMEREEKEGPEIDE